MCDGSAPPVRKDLRAADLFPVFGVDLPLQFKDTRLECIGVAEPFGQRRTARPLHLQHVFIGDRVKPRFHAKGVA